MSFNTFGHLFRFTSFGESHGAAIGCVVDGCPPGLALTEADVQHDLDRRRPGQSRHTSQRREADAVRILRDAPDHLTDGGVLVCEVGASQPALEALLPDLPLSWVEFEHGGDGVFVIDAAGLVAHRDAVAAAIDRR